MSAPWRDKEPFRWIKEVFTSFIECQDDPGGDVDEAMNGALHEMDDLNARITALRARVDKLERVLRSIGESQPRQVTCPDGIAGCLVLHTNGEIPLHSDIWMWNCARAALED